MNTLNLFWGYLTGEEHLTDEQFAQIDFGNPAIDVEFITFDPLASSYFHGKYFHLFERKFSFPHRTLPTMRIENIVVYDGVAIKIIDPPINLNTPIGIFLCLIMGKKQLIKPTLDFLGKKINLNFSPCDFNLELFYLKLIKTRFKITPISLTINNIDLNKNLTGNLEVFIENHPLFLNNLKAYKAKIKQIKISLQEVNLQFEMTINDNGIIEFETEIMNLNLLDTIYDVASRCVFTGS